MNRLCLLSSGFYFISAAWLKEKDNHSHPPKSPPKEKTKGETILLAALSKIGEKGLGSVSDGGGWWAYIHLDPSFLRELGSAGIWYIWSDTRATSGVTKHLASEERLAFDLSGRDLERPPASVSLDLLALTSVLPFDRRIISRGVLFIGFIFGGIINACNGREEKAKEYLGMGFHILHGSGQGLRIRHWARKASSAGEGRDMFSG